MCKVAHEESTNLAFILTYEHPDTRVKKSDHNSKNNGHLIAKLIAHVKLAYGPVLDEYTKNHI